MNDYTFEPVGDIAKPYTPLSADAVNELDQARRALDAVMGPAGMTAGEALEAAVNTAGARRATVADVMAVMPVGGSRYRPPILISALRMLVEQRREVTNARDAAADAIHHGLVEIEGSDLTTTLRITDKGSEFVANVLPGWDPARCPLPHEYEVFVPGAVDGVRTSVVEQLLPRRRQVPQSSIFAYHCHPDGWGYCTVESRRVDEMATTQPLPNPEITGFVVAGGDRVMHMTARQVMDEMARVHCGDYEDDPDSDDVTYVHLRGENVLRAVELKTGEPRTDEDDWMHFTTQVVLTGGTVVGELHWRVDGRV